MANERRATGALTGLGRQEFEQALAASGSAESMSAFYAEVRMTNPSRSYYIQHGGRLHSLKAVAAWALQQRRSSTQARDFHARHAAIRAAALGFDVVHRGSKWDGQS